MKRPLLRLARAFLLIAAGTAAPPAASGADHVVRIVSDYRNLQMAFVPDHLEIAPGDRVTWINEADEEHDVVTFPDGYPRGAKGFQSPVMTRAGEEFSHHFDVPGTYEYHCMPHLAMGMRGMIVVGRASARHELHEPSNAEMKAYRETMMEWLDGEDIEALLRERASGTEDRTLAAGRSMRSGSNGIDRLRY